MDQILFWKLMNFIFHFRNGICCHVNLQRQNFITEFTPKSKIIPYCVIAISVATKQSPGDCHTTFAMTDEFAMTQRAQTCKNFDFKSKRRYYLQEGKRRSNIIFQVDKCMI
jgi:hypothetical protein